MTTKYTFFERFFDISIDFIEKNYIYIPYRNSEMKELKEEKLALEDRLKKANDEIIQLVREKVYRFKDLQNTNLIFLLNYMNLIEAV